jgi:hypothetical protein
MKDTENLSSDRILIEKLRSELAKSAPTRRRRIIEKFVLAALGSIPWIGGFLNAAADYKFQESSVRQDSLQTQWLEEHQAKLSELRYALDEIQRRFEALGEGINERLQSDGYLTLVRKTFRAWDSADTAEKKRYLANVITNAAGTRVCSDDVVRLFIDWLELYHEAHFAVIRQIYSNPGYSRFEIWTDIYGELVREDSAEADLYRLLIRDLSTGGVIRQVRDVNELGQFVRRKPRRVRAPDRNPNLTLESAFEDSKPYALTELGKQFVHYTMNEVVTRIDGPGSRAP